jgi:hypothetical protein
MARAPPARRSAEEEKRILQKKYILFEKIFFEMGGEEDAKVLRTSGYLFFKLTVRKRSICREIPDSTQRN